MKRISKITNDISELFQPNHQLYKFYNNEPQKFNLACASKDLLEDTCLALENYEKTEFTSDYGDRYLKIHGFLQVVVLQQNSVSELYKIFVNDKFKISCCNELQKIRDIRNSITGHPLNYKNKSGSRTTTITRVTIEKYSIDLVETKIPELNGISTKHIELGKLYDFHKSKIIELLSEIVTKITEISV